MTGNKLVSILRGQPPQDDGLAAVERALTVEYAPIAEPERIARIGEQQGAVMKKVCDEVARQFETRIELAEAAITDLTSHRDHLIRQLSQYLNDEIDLRIAEVERTKQCAKDITAWVQAEAHHFAEHATEVADKLSRLQERIASASNGLPKNVPDATPDPSPVVA